MIEGRLDFLGDAEVQYAVRICVAVSEEQFPAPDSEPRQCEGCDDWVWYHVPQFIPSEHEGMPIEREVIVCLLCGMLCMALFPPPEEREEP